MGLTRTEQWDTVEFHEFLLTSKDKPFEWSTNDCCIWAANGVQSFTKTDIASDFRGKYKDQASAFALIKTVTGGESVADAAAYCANKHGLVEWTHPLLAKRGDLVVIDNGGTLIAGLVHLNGRHVVTISESGLVRLPITTITRAWKV